MTKLKRSLPLYGTKFDLASLITLTSDKVHSVLLSNVVFTKKVNHT
jgi:hypothetical protein